MSTQIKMRRGTTSQHSSFTGAEAEVTIDTDKEVAVVHNGSTAGGFPLARADQTLALAGGTMAGTFTVGVNDTGYDVKFFGATAGAYMLWDESADDLILGGAAGLSVNSAALVTGVLTTTAATVFNGGFASNADSTVGGTLGVTGIATFTDDIIIGDGKTIGSASDTDAMAIASTGLVSFNRPRSNTAGDVTLSIDPSDTTVTYGFRIDNANNAFNIDRVDNTTNLLSISSAGNVIIASTGGTLQTATAGTSNLRLGANAGNSLVSGSDYNVLIGDEAGTGLNVYTADANVAIGHKAMFEATSANNNVAIGQSAMRDASTGTFNIAIGPDAMGDGVVTGNHNLAMGYLSLENLTGGAGNIALGREALETLTTGNNNIAIGQFALEATNGSEVVSVGGASGLVYTSTDSVFVGYSAGKFATSGAGQTFVGHSAGQGITGTKLTGTNNTAIGRDSGLVLQGNAYSNTFIGANSGKAATIGIQNTFAGDGAGDSLTDSDYNVAVGYLALSAVCGNGNTAVGTEALKACTNTRNTALGYHAGLVMTGGDNNTVLGYECGKGVLGGHNNTFVGRSAGEAVNSGNYNTIMGSSCYDNLTTGSSNTAFGHNLGQSAFTVSSEVVIGSDTTGAGANTVRIGTAAGNATLGLDGSDTSWAAASDSRLKKDVTDSTVGLEFIKDLRPVTFKWNAKNAIADSLPQYDADSSDPVYGQGKAHHGFIAQEVKTVIDAHSDVVNGHNIWAEDPNGTQQVAPSALVPMLVKAIQELEARIATLEG